MRFLKTQNLSRYGLTDTTLSANPYGRYIMNGTGGLRVPKGPAAAQPQLSQVKTPGGANGYIRYNTDTNTLEAYIAGAWEQIGRSSTEAITKQTIGPGNYEEIFFGPLAQTPASINNILVFVENVFQISVTNFTLIQNPPGLAKATYGLVVEDQPYPAGTYIRFESPVPLDKNVTIYFGFA
jgi:hypothetical protein